MLKPQLRLHLTQRQRMVPKMIVASELMMMNVAQLEERLERLIEENPLVEIQENTRCYGCGEVIVVYLERCPRCGRLLHPQEVQEFAWEEMAFLGKKRNWREILEEEVETFVELTEEEEKVFRLLLMHLDNSGFLKVSTKRLAFSLQLEEDKLLVVIERLRQAGFTGFAASDALEFLIIQALQLGLLQGDLEVLRREIVNQPEKFEKILAPHRDQLFFSPAQLFESTLLGQERGELPEENSVVPDAEIVEVTKSDFEVVLYTPSSLNLNLNEEVLSIYYAQRKKMPAKELSFWQEKIQEAKEVISCLSYRHKLLLQVLEYIVMRESDFLTHGVRHFVPLRQRDIAEALGISISAVCQILCNKYLRFPDGVVRSVKFFFDASYPVKEAIRKIIDTEDPRHPLSDREIVAELQKYGFPIARRTCALYREELGILPSHLRRKFVSR